MGNQADKRFTWVIENFSSLDSKGVYSDIFVAGRCKWQEHNLFTNDIFVGRSLHVTHYTSLFDSMGFACRRLLAYKRTENRYSTYLSLYLCVHNFESLASGWRRHAKFSFTIANQIPGELSQLRETQCWFDQKTPHSGFNSMFSISELGSYRHNGLVVNGELKIVAEVDVLEVIGKLDVSEDTTGTIDINGFQVPASQVESVNSLFEKYPGFASKLCPKNPQLKTACLTVILNLSESLCKSPDELSSDDLADAYSALQYVIKAGFKLDWLEKKLKETGESRLQEIEEKLNGMKVKCADMEALLEFLR